jgi:hypothetical protein
MQSLPPERPPQPISLEDNTTNLLDDASVEIVQCVNPLPVINEERYVMSGALATGDTFSSPALAHTRRSEHDARIEDVNSYRSGVNERKGMGEGDPGFARMASSSVDEPSTIGRVDMESERNIWTTVSTFANNANFEPPICKPGREPTRNCTSGAVDLPTGAEFTDINLYGETVAEDEKEMEKHKKAKRRSGRVKEQREKERREKALSEASAKLEGTWEGYEEQQRQMQDDVIDYSKLQFE